MAKLQTQKEERTTFLWQPGHGPSLSALKRLKAEFPKPAKPCGEAWFLGKTRHLYSELLSQNLEAIAPSQIESIFFEMTSGWSCFGAEDNWDDWYHYLLYYLLENGDCRSGELIQSLCSAAFVIDLHDGKTPYAQYRSDLLWSLGQSVMHPSLWHATDEPTNESAPELIEDIHQIFDWNFRAGCSQAISTSMFLCLDLLSERQMDDWLQSILRIECIYWKANILCWFVGANELLFAPELFCKEKSGITPDISWRHDHLVRSSGYRFDRDKLVLLFETLRVQMDLPRFLIWIQPMFDDSKVGDALNSYLITDRFADSVLAGKRS